MMCMMILIQHLYLFPDRLGIIFASNRPGINRLQVIRFYQAEIISIYFLQI